MELENLVVHSTNTPFGLEVELEDINEEHIEKFGRIGFSDVIDFDGKIQSTLQFYNYKKGERPYNWDINNSRHIAYIGGVSEDGFNLQNTMSPEQQETLDIYIEFMKRRHPNIKIINYTKTNLFTEELS